MLYKIYNNNNQAGHDSLLAESDDLNEMHEKFDMYSKFYRNMEMINTRTLQIIRSN